MSTRAPDLELTARVDKVGNAVQNVSSFHRGAPGPEERRAPEGAPEPLHHLRPGDLAAEFSLLWRVFGLVRASSEPGSDRTAGELELIERDSPGTTSADDPIVVVPLPPKPADNAA